MNELSARVISGAEVIPEAYLMWLEAPAIASAARPGQFIMAHCGDELLLRRPFSIHQVSGDSLAILFSIVGRGTAWLARRQPGDRVDLLGPLGNGFTLPEKAWQILLVAGGIGIAPLVFLADEALKQGKKVTLLMGARTSACLYPEGFLPDGIKFAIATEDGSAGEQGMITDTFRGLASVAATDRIYACGPLPIYRRMAQMPELRDKSVQVSLEVVMGCGVGVCYGCTVKTRQGLKQVCRDGPVFDLHDVLWDQPIC